MKEKVSQLSYENKIETIIISGSMRFKQEMTSLSNKLKNDGYKKVVEPSEDEYNKSVEEIEKAKNHMIFESLIECADLLLVYDKNGYVGLSTAMEIQKALDCNVPVRFLFEPEAIEFKSLCVHPYYDVRVDTKYFK